jgi:branched-chain amino acid transport system substrate-binding protein
MHKIVLKVLALLVVGLLVTACEAGEKAPATGTPAAPSPIKLKTDHGVTDTEIKIGSTGGKSGGYTLGLPFQVGMESYFKKVNQEDGGVCNRKIRFIGEDDQGTAALALDRARKLVEQDDVLALNSFRTTAVMGAASYLNDPDGNRDPSDGVPYLWTIGGSVETADPAKWPWGPIQLNPLYYDFSKSQAEAINRLFPGAKAAILFQNDDFGRDSAAGFKAGFTGTVVAEQAHDPNAPDISGQLATLRAASPDLLVVASSARFMPPLYRYREGQAWQVKVVWLYPYGGSAALMQALGGTDPASQQQALRLIAGTITGQFLLDPFADQNHPAMREHVRILNTYGGGFRPNEYTLAGQAAAEAYVEAIKRACDRGDLTRKGLLQAAETMAGFHPSVFKEGVNLETSPSRHVGAAKAAVGEIQPDGTIRPLR